MDNAVFIPNSDGVQSVRSKFFAITLTQLVACSNVINFQLPADSEVVGGAITVDTAFDGGTTDTIAVGDDVTAARYLTATDAKSAGMTKLVPTGYLHSAATTQNLRVTRATTGAAATKGSLRIRVDYVQLNRAENTQG